SAVVVMCCRPTCSITWTLRPPAPRRAFQARSGHTRWQAPALFRLQSPATGPRMSPCRELTPPRNRMFAVAFLDIVWAAVPLVGGFYVLLLGLRLGGRRPGVTPATDVWYRRYGWMHKIAGPLLILFGVFRLLEMSEGVTDTHLAWQRFTI